MNDVSTKWWSSYISPSAVSAPTKVSEIDNNIIKAMFVSLKSIPLTTMRDLCELILHAPMSNHDIRNEISQQGLPADVDIGWLGSLSEQGVKKILTIIDTLEKNKEEIYYRHYGKVTSDENGQNRSSDFSLSIFKEELSWNSCTSYEIVVDVGILYLKETFCYIKEQTSTLLDEFELLELLYGNDISELLVSEVSDPYLQTAVLIQTVKVGDRSDIWNINTDLQFMSENIFRGSSEKIAMFVKAHPGFSVQYMLKNLRWKNWVDVGQIYTLIFPEKKSMMSYEISHSVIAVNNTSRNSADNMADNVADNVTGGAPTLLPELQVLLFRHLSIEDQWRLAKTSKFHLAAYANFCKWNLQQDHTRVTQLKNQGQSEIQIFHQNPWLRKEPCVPQCQIGLNSLAKHVLNPIAIEFIKNGQMGILEANQEAHQMNLHLSASPKERVILRYCTHDFLSKKFIDGLTSDEHVYLDEFIAVFAINSLQLDVKQTLAAKKQLCRDRFFLKAPIDDDSDQVFDYIQSGELGESDVNIYLTVWNLLSSSQLTVKRLLELSNDQIFFMCEMYQSIKMSPQAALHLFELAEVYEESGWPGLQLLLDGPASHPFQQPQ